MLRGVKFHNTLGVASVAERVVLYVRQCRKAESRVKWVGIVYGPDHVSQWTNKLCLQLAVMQTALQPVFNVVRPSVRLSVTLKTHTVSPIAMHCLTYSSKSTSNSRLNPSNRGVKTVHKLMTCGPVMLSTHVEQK